MADDNTYTDNNASESMSYEKFIELKKRLGSPRPQVFGVMNMNTALEYFPEAVQAVVELSGGSAPRTFSFEFEGIQMHVSEYVPEEIDRIILIEKSWPKPWRFLR